MNEDMYDKGFVGDDIIIEVFYLVKACHKTFK